MLIYGCDKMKTIQLKEVCPTCKEQLHFNTTYNSIWCLKCHTKYDKIKLSQYSERLIECLKYKICVCCKKPLSRNFYGKRFYCKECKQFVLLYRKRLCSKIIKEIKGFDIPNFDEVKKKIA